MAETDQFTKKMQKRFGFIVKSNAQGPSTITPGKYRPETGNITPIKMSSTIERYFENWKRDFTNYNELRDRNQRYKDLEFMCLNSGIMFLATTIISQETVVPQEDDSIIQVYAKQSKVESYIYDFFRKIGITRQVLEALSNDIAIYGDHFWINHVSPTEGVVGITPIEVYEIADRLEFSAYKEYNKLMGMVGASPTSTKSSIDDLANTLKANIKDQDYGEMYRKYLFGFKLATGDILPPWAVTHFRRFNVKNEFAPFGRPQFINSLSLYRQFKSGQSLVAMARVAKFPKEVFSIQADRGMTAAQKWAAVNEVRQEYFNFTGLDNGKEDFGVNSSLWTVKELIDYDIFPNNIEIGDIADIEMLEKDLITSTTVPPDYLTQEGSWGASDKALLHQSKIFSRNVYINQSAILEALTALVKLHLAITGDFEAENTEFELSLSFPVVEETNDQLEFKSKTMEFANSVIENLKLVMGVDDIPPEVTFDIFSKFAFLDKQDLDLWSKQIKKSQEASKPVEINEKIRRGLDRLTEDQFREIYFRSKKSRGLDESIYKKRHCMTSFGPTKYEESLYKSIRKVSEEKLEG